MDWYYAEGDERRGPLSDDEFHGLVNAGRITSATLVWNANMGDQWLPYGEVRNHQAAPALDVPGGATYMGSAAMYDGGMHYGGFWIRFCAKVLDSIILAIVYAAVAMSMAVLSGGDEGLGLVIGLVLSLFNFVFPIAYDVFFIGKFAATPGKMALGLKIVRSDGDRVSYLRAFGRHFAEFLSAIILFMGYVMAAFDDEKRALHDRICDTRVVHSR